MKTLLINTALMLTMFAAPTAATTGMRHATVEHTVCTSPDHKSQKGNRWHNKRKRYFVINNKVYYNGEVVNGATASGFKILDDGYAADDFRVYYDGEKLEGATASSFKTLKDGYAADDFRVYYRGRKIEGVFASGFEVLKDGYARDNFNVYYRGRKVE